MLNTADGRRKVRNVRRDPRVMLAAHAPETLEPALKVRGTVVEITPEGGDAHIDALSRRYRGEPWEPVPGQTRAAAADPSRPRPDGLRWRSRPRTARSPRGCGPRTPAEFVGQTHLVGPGRVLQRLIDRGTLPSLVLWGPAGTGKTTLAHLLADTVGAHLVTLSATSSGVADARKVMQEARAAACSRRSCSWTRSTGGRRRSRTSCCPRSRTARSR